MKQKYLCLKDFKVNDIVHFEKGKFYDGKEVRNSAWGDINTVRMKSDYGLKIHFHTGSEYFDIHSATGGNSDDRN